MEDKNIVSFFRWVRQEKYSVFVTFLGAALPPLISWTIKALGETPFMSFQKTFLSDDNLPFATQFLFILVTLYFLFDYRARILNDLVTGKAHIINYIKKNCFRKLKKSKEAEDNFRIVKRSVYQFYSAWIIVWLIWLAYYMGNYLMILMAKDNEIGRLIFSQCFDFLSSTAMLFIYVILTNVTINIDKTRQFDDSIQWYGLFIWVFLFVFILILVMLEGYYGNTEVGKDYQNLCALFLSIISSVVFVLVLGKMNSHYLRIPRLFMFIIYVYAIIQAYIPFEQIECIGSMSHKILHAVVPSSTLIGKVFLMLTLCWVVNKKRLIFFIIHRSNALFMTNDLLSELDQEPVNF